MKYYRIFTGHGPAWARELIFPPGYLVWFVSRVMTLLPGDMITTGTPSGIGPLEAGDVVEVEVEGVGVLRNPRALTPGKAMPLYEYVCAGCDLRFERYVRAWGEAVACPECSSAVVEKQLSRFAMAGSGGSDMGPRGAGCCGGACGCGH